MPTTEHLKSIIESAIDFAIIVTDLDGQVTDWNAGAEKIFGWSKAEMVGGSAERIFTPEDRQIGRLQEEMRLAAGYNSANDERWHLKKDGTRFWASGEMMPLRGGNGEHRGFVKIARDRTRQHEAGKQLQVSEDKFQTLLQTIDTAFAIVEVKFEADRPVNYRFLEANPAFERQAGVNLRGKWVTEFAPNLEKFWFETYGRVAATGEPAAFESYAEAFNRWFDVRAIRVGNPDDRQIAIFFTDSTARRELELRNSAIIEISDRLRDLSDPTEIAYAGAKVIGSTLRASRVGYGTIDIAAATVVVQRDWAEADLPDLPKPIRFEDYGQFFVDLTKGTTVAVSDVRIDTRTIEQSERLEEIGARSFLNLPIFERGHLVAILYVGHRSPHVWTDNEIIFLRDVAERIRAATERAQADKDLRR